MKAFTGAVPFSDKSPHATRLAIICGERPPRPTGPALTDSLWALTQQCWDQEAQLRPQALQIACGLCVATLRPLYLGLIGFSRAAAFQRGGA